METQQYTNSLTNYNRFKTREVCVGKIPVGGDNPLRIQSMTDTDTKDVKKTVEQILRIFEHGADFVRITTPTFADIEASKDIKRSLHEKGFADKPLVADVHFNPKVALAALDIFEKVRINPGNLVDKKLRFKEITDQLYNEELAKIEEQFGQILKKAKNLKKSLRIGTNHGSLSDRILFRYGNSPEGMVIATMEYLRIARKHDFDQIIVSLKASNPSVMVYANRLLVKKMQEENMNYPLHLGVTEAGNDLQGRIKSAVGIGALLTDGIGDTIRVSLTEPPENEIPVCLKIVNHIEKRAKQTQLPEIPFFFNPYEYNPRQVYKTPATQEGLPIVISSRKFNNSQADFFEENNYLVSTKNKAFRIISAKEYLQQNKSDETVFIRLNYRDLTKDFFKKLKSEQNAVLIAELLTDNITGEARFFVYKLVKEGCKAPVVLKYVSQENNPENFAISASIDLGVLLIDGLINGIWLENSNLQPQETEEIAFEILQATGRRITKAEYISCPGCGRTLFDLQEVTNKIKAATQHLKGIKIAIMGCIVNGPGEMADADYGYVGSKPGLITLYRGKTPVKYNVKEEQAIEELINLIKQDGKWTEK